MRKSPTYSHNGVHQLFHLNIFDLMRCKMIAKWMHMSDLCAGHVLRSCSSLCFTICATSCLTSSFFSSPLQHNVEVHSRLIYCAIFSFSTNTHTFELAVETEFVKASDCDLLHLSYTRALHHCTRNRIQICVHYRDFILLLCIYALNILNFSLCPAIEIYFCIFFGLHENGKWN